MTETHKLLLALCDQLGYKVDTVCETDTLKLCKRDAIMKIKDGNGWTPEMPISSYEHGEDIVIRRNISINYNLTPNVNTLIKRAREILPKGYKLTLEKT